MRIGINAALVGASAGYRQTGISRYISELIASLQDELAPSDELVLLGTESAALAEKPQVRIAWEQTVLPLFARRQHLDVLHGPMSVVPYVPGVGRVTTVHDLAFVKFPHHVARARRTYLVAGTRLSAKTADRIITVSQQTADDLMAWLKIPAKKIEVIPLAPSPKIQPVEGTSLHVFQMKAEITKPYILAVGTLEPRKNIPFLLQVFASLKHEIPHDLVLVGPEGWLTGPLHDTLTRLGLGDRVRLTGFVTDEELGAWYSGADLFAFPSTYEGFGLPTVEAMRCGAPVLTSNTSCFPEIVGDAGVMEAPNDLPGWRLAIRELTTDRARRDELIARGRERAAQFSWQRTAQETLRVYREVAR